jgi:hypothetical protein
MYLKGARQKEMPVCQYKPKQPKGTCGWETAGQGKEQQEEKIALYT